jgi:hypothetical protein
MVRSPILKYVPAANRTSMPHCLAAARGLPQPASNTLIVTQASVQTATNRDDALADTQARPLLDQVGGHPPVTVSPVVTDLAVALVEAQ